MASARQAGIASHAGAECADPETGPGLPWSTGMLSLTCFLLSLRVFPGS